jgi:hypothetical protein
VLKRVLGLCASVSRERVICFELPRKETKLRQFIDRREGREREREREREG